MTVLLNPGSITEKIDSIVARITVIPGPTRSVVVQMVLIVE
jgi:hypothetical protein